MHNQPTISLNGSEIPLTHIKQLRIKCNQTIQLRRTIAHADWGADKKKTNYTDV